MKIALLSAEYPPRPGGVGDYTERLGQALVERGHAVYAFTIASGQFQIIDLAGPTPNPQSAIDNLQSGWGWRSWRGVRRALERTAAEVLHIQYQTGAYGMHPAINLLPWHLRRQPRRPRVVVTAHDLLLPYLFPKAGPARGWVTRRLLADADAAVVTNPSDLTEAAQSYHVAPELIPIGSNIAVAPPASYDRGSWRARLGASDADTLVAYFGLLSRTKGAGVLLDALARLPATTRLLIIGGAATAPEDRAYAEQFRQQLAESQLADRVTLTGHCPADQVSAHLLAADIAALPFSDGASFRRGSLLAALAHGLPIVTTEPQEPRTESREPIAHSSALGSRLLVPRLADGENVLLIAPGDAGALAQALARLAGDHELRARLGHGGAKLARQFAWPAIAAQHEALYAKLLQH
jgi:glycosyltransferase involved in cell wall biosynthesis